MSLKHDIGFAVTTLPAVIVGLVGAVLGVSGFLYLILNLFYWIGGDGWGIVPWWW